MEFNLDDYFPAEDEPYMNMKQLAYFKKKLIEWKDSLIKESMDTIKSLQEEDANNPDLTDRASVEIERFKELRSRDRYRKLIEKIEAAMSRIDEGSYGYCIETGDPIGIKRLDARPVATLSIEAQEKRENYERNHNEED